MFVDAEPLTEDVNMYLPVPFETNYQTQLSFAVLYASIYLPDEMEKYNGIVLWDQKVSPWTTILLLDASSIGNCIIIRQE